MQKVLQYTSWLQNQTNFYPSNNILHQIGGDFEWSYDAPRLYKGIDFNMRFLNAHPEGGFQMHYSTPRNYTKSVYKAFLENKTRDIVVKHDDFLPYADVPHAFWTGYYTSRASFKRQIRYFG